MLGLGWMVAAAVLGETLAVDAPMMTPVFNVEAPQDTQRVTAYFPFGLQKELTLDSRSMRWRGRAVIHPSIPEGSYPVALVLHSADGGQVVRRELVDLKHDLVPFDAALSQPVVTPGDAAEITVDTVEPATRVTASCAALGWRNVPLGPPTQGPALEWGALREVPSTALPGAYAVVLALQDGEGHTLSRMLTLTVVPRKTL